MRSLSNRYRKLFKSDIDFSVSIYGMTLRPSNRLDDLGSLGQYGITLNEPFGPRDVQQLLVAESYVIFLG